MCGRFVQSSLLELLMHKIDPSWQSTPGQQSAQPTWNLAPSQQAWTILASDTGLMPARMTWGYRPAWAKEDAPTPINARLETVSAKPYFREAWQRARCLVPADGYYEWQKQAGASRPYYISMADKSPMMLAGLYAVDSQDRHRFTVLTARAAGAELGAIHGRMPLIMDTPLARSWLAGASPDDYTLDEMAANLCAHPVASLVNSPANNGEQLIQAC